MTWYSIFCKEAMKIIIMFGLNFYCILLQVLKTTMWCDVKRGVLENKVIISYLLYCVCLSTSHLFLYKGYPCRTLYMCVSLSLLFSVRLYIALYVRLLSLTLSICVCLSLLERRTEWQIKYVCQSVSLCHPLSVTLCLSPSVCHPLSVTLFCQSLFVSLSVTLCHCLLLCLSVSLSVRLSITLSVCQSLCPSITQSLCPSNRS